MLNKVFTVNQRNFTIDFMCNNESCKDFFIRAMPIYSSAQDASKPVQCCIQHRLSTERYNQGRTKLATYHILRSIHNHAQYTGGRERHLSVVVPLGTPQAGMDIVRSTFFFVCKNSCATGINRRAVDLIFTLEDNVGNILGRRKISVRVCSCPKRDKMKEEEEYLKNSGQPAQRGKKRKYVPKKPSSLSDPNDNKVYPINIEVVGKRNCKAVLNYARSLMATEVVDRDGEEPFNRCFNVLTNNLRNHDLS
ncbi:hypothetical protein AMK59_7668 [Oryctes borbonicus]|uniref:p53 DNA-binding domain-containing protein n=1 Tax=Oryctes borbonicus TaxID=1629725 RepID=A0A0T6AUA4_9SCAR|nr:hypothetical protein AMK59_7668 [Oryctes borbonicus]